MFLPTVRRHWPLINKRIVHPFRIYFFSNILFAFTFGVISLDCKGEISEPLPNASGNDLTSIIPMAIGHSWKYKVTEYIGSGSRIRSDSTTIVDTIRIDGAKYYMLKGPNPVFVTFLFRDTIYFETIDREDYSIYVSPLPLTRASTESLANTTVLLPLHILKAPIVKGHQWRVAEWDSIYQYDFGTLTILNTDTAVKFGQFVVQHSIHVSSGPFLEYFIVPGIGIVRKSGGVYDYWVDMELVGWRFNGRWRGPTAPNTQNNAAQVKSHER